jgi:hypothetical protein
VFSGEGTAAEALLRGECKRRRADDCQSSALLLFAVLLERYLERELDLAFRLGSAGKETEVGIRHRVVGLRRALERAKGCLIPGVEEVRPKDDTSLLFAEWKHLFQRQVRIGNVGRSEIISGLAPECVGSGVCEACLVQVLHVPAPVIGILTQAVRSLHHVPRVLQIIVAGIVVKDDPGVSRVNSLETPPSNDFIEQRVFDVKPLPSAKRQLINPAEAKVLRKIVSRNTPIGR